MAKATKAEVMRVKQYYDNNPHSNNLVRKTACACAFRHATVRDAYEQLGIDVNTKPNPVTERTDPPADSGNVRGISLRSLRVSVTKPQQTVKSNIRRLKRGLGYKLTDLAHAWNVSEETVRKHAKQLKCLKYVEVSPDEWETFVLNPETAEDYQDRG